MKVFQLFIVWLFVSENATRIIVNASSAQISLPPLIYLETFDSTPEGTLPPGWTQANFSTRIKTSFDLSDPTSATYEGWVVVDRKRLDGNPFGRDRLNVAPNQILNGTLITNLVVGRCVYAESDNRSGSQVQYLFSPDFDLSGVIEVSVSYYSIYTQNQDSIGAVEFSTDGGATWLPVVYMLDREDILRGPTGAIDAVATFTTRYSDVATYTDPVTRQQKGGDYGAFVGAPITQALAPFISGRINDDPTESKRVEAFRLPEADNRSRVRFRFAQAGTGSWYFGIDNFGIYGRRVAIPDSPPLIVRQPQDQTASLCGPATFTVDAVSLAPVSYQWRFDGTILPDATSSTLAISHVGFAELGDYTVSLTNPFGTVVSQAAKLSLSPLPAAVTNAVFDLSEWSVVQYEFNDQDDASWVFSSANSVVTQTVNADASILVSDTELVGDLINGTWRVEGTAGDDDFMGFVFGFRDSRHFYLFDWKLGDQNDAFGFAERGMSVKVVNANSPLSGSDLWPTKADTNRVRLLYHNTIPWEKGVDYDFALEFRSGRFAILVMQGQTRLAGIELRDDTYGSGKFGFYNYSQDSVRYSGFTRTTLQRPPIVCIDSPLDGTVLLAGTDLKIGASAGDIDGVVTQVGFYANGQRIGTAGTAPYTVNWTNVAHGTYELTARAIDNVGLISTSAPVNISVTLPDCTDNTLSKLIDLRHWTVVQYEFLVQQDARWELDATKSVATQTVNADASILLSDFDVTNRRILGNFSVQAASDDDFIGFVFGFQDDRHFYLFDWKASDQDDPDFGFPCRHI